MPAGTFRIDSKGNAMMMHDMETEGIQARAFAITIEPASGARHLPARPSWQQQADSLALLRSDRPIAFGSAYSVSIRRKTRWP